MKEIIVFAGSNSQNSINKKLALLAASNLNSISFKVLDLNDYDLPVYSIDLENDKGFPQHLVDFKEEIAQSAGIILSLAEHNGAYTAVFKNLMDWLSRYDAKFWGHKPMLLLSTSPGQRGGQFVMDMALSRFPILGSDIIAHFSLPSFNENYSETKLLDTKLQEKFLNAIDKFEETVNQ